MRYAKHHLKLARAVEKAAAGRAKTHGSKDALVREWRAEGKRERLVARRALEKARRFRGVYSRDARSRDPGKKYETTIGGLRATVEYHPKSRLWGVTLHAKTGHGTLPGQSGRTAEEAERKTREFMARLRPANDRRRSRKSGRYGSARDRSRRGSKRRSR
jgi:hypothetical protein